MLRGVAKWGVPLLGRGRSGMGAIMDYLEYISRVSFPEKKN